MLTTELLEKIVHFTIGKPHKVMGVAYMMLCLNVLLGFYRVKGFLLNLKKGSERLIGYTAFIVLANVLDSIAVDNLFGWRGSTQFLVCLYIVAKEIRDIANYLTERFGISIPIINDRLNQMEQGQINPGSSWQDPSVDIEKRIERLRGELTELERRQSGELPPEKPTDGPKG